MGAIIATLHDSLFDHLGRYGAQPVVKRVVFQLLLQDQVGILADRRDDLPLLLSYQLFQKAFHPIF